MFWNLGFAVLYSIKDIVPPSEAFYMVRRINWNLGQFSNTLHLAYHSLSLCVCWQGQNLLQDNVPKQPAPDSGSAHLTKNPHLDSQTESCHDDRESSCHGSGSSVDSMERKGHSVPFLMHCSGILHWHHIRLLCRLVLCHNFCIHWKNTASNRIVPNTVRVHHLKLRCYPLLLYNFKWFNI